MAYVDTGLNLPSDELLQAWKTKAVAQGILCLVCGAAPSLEHREAFYDTGLCNTCADDVARSEAPNPAQA